jgi:hypothetical protein
VQQAGNRERAARDYFFRPAFRLPLTPNTPSYGLLPPYAEQPTTHDDPVVFPCVARRTGALSVHLGSR